MKEDQLLERIVVNPDVMVGKPVIQGTRLTVEYILSLLSHSVTPEEILAEYNGLTLDDIQACLLFAAKALESNLFMPLTDEEVKLEVKSEQIVIRPTYEARHGWEAAFQAMAERHDDELLGDEAC